MAFSHYGALLGMTCRIPTCYLIRIGIVIALTGYDCGNVCISMALDQVSVFLYPYSYQVSLEGTCVYVCLACARIV